MDDINRKILDAQRRAARTEPGPVTPAEPEPPIADPSEPAVLRMERRQGEWRYYLGEERMRPGQPIEFHVDARIGWVRGTFQWGRRNVSVATIRVPVFHPADPAQPIGEMEVTLPDAAVCRRPSGA